MFALYALSGFCVGALVGMTGVGGGSLMTPLLILLFGIHPVAGVRSEARCSLCALIRFSACPLARAASG
jgi:uncharacterized membrane protein YfcA